MLVPFLFSCNLDPFRCLTVIFFSWFIKYNFFSLHNSFKTIFTSTTFLRCWSFLTVIFETDTSHVPDFKEVATPIIDSTICLGRLCDVNRLFQHYQYFRLTINLGSFVRFVLRSFYLHIPYFSTWGRFHICSAIFEWFGNLITLYVLQYTVLSHIIYILLQSSDEFLFFLVIFFRCFLFIRWCILTFLVRLYIFLSSLSLFWCSDVFFEAISLLLTLTCEMVLLLSKLFLRYNYFC